MKHYSVMLKETIDMLNVKENGIYVDGTLGRGGHSSEILKQLTTGHLYAFDLDAQAIKESKERLEKINNNFTLIHDNFANIKKRLNELNVNKVDGIILDLGVSSPQFDETDRGFSYRYDAMLDMRMNQDQTFSAYDVVNKYSFNDLVRILYVYGEEKFAKQIARSIEKNRSIKPIETTFELVEVIKQALPAKVLSKKGHPAKQTFQAIRIEVNQELESLKNILKEINSLLDVNGRCCIITFHSLEDRIVKECFNELSSVPYIDKRVPIKPEDLKQADYRLINKKIIVASESELDENSRSKSAKLRGIEKVR